MLSTKRSTSWPSSSRKYSAIVRPVRATRRRTPGGSFIWPKTSTVFSSTPDSRISTQRSLPSRERSPTPAKTEKPPCSRAMLRISSLMMHGLADAGAAVEADLTARAKGAIEVDDLDAGLEDLRRRSPAPRRTAAGGGSASARRPSTSPRLSSGLPSTLKSRPSVGSPTGTAIGAPVSVAVGAAAQAVGACPSPGAHPVVAEVLLHFGDELLAVARCRSRPRCRSPAGASAGNSTSTTVPMT